MLLKLKVRYCIHNSPPPVPILSQINPVHAAIPLFKKISILVLSYLGIVLPIGFFLAGFRIRTFYLSLLSPHT
jgi:hypothetical protein